MTTVLGFGLPTTTGSPTPTPTRPTGLVGKEEAGTKELEPEEGPVCTRGVEVDEGSEEKAPPDPWHDTGTGGNLTESACRGVSDREAESWPQNRATLSELPRHGARTSELVSPRETREKAEDVAL